MKQRWLMLAAFGLLLTAYRTGAQAPPAAPAPASGILGLCQALEAKLAACKAKICACPLGQMLQAMAKPINLATGGMICPPCCPPINPDDLKKASNTPQGACAKIKQEEAEAPARRASVRCLAYYDCHWYPEAEAALIVALRTDRSECVRFEAARVLGTGCCCTRKTIEALTLVVNGSSKDGNPSENSMRVQAAAYQSLQRCIDAFHDETEPKRPELPPEGPKALLTAMPVDEEVRLMAQAVANARKALEQTQFVSRGGQAPLQTGSRSLFDVMKVATDSVPDTLPERMPTSPSPLGQASEKGTSAPVQGRPTSTGRRGILQIWADSARQPAEPGNQVP